MSSTAVKERQTLAGARVASAELAVDSGFVPIGKTRRPGLGDCKTPAEVKAASDLPDRLFLGSLDTGSFRLQKAGWSARYVDTNPQTFVDIDFDIERKPPLVAQHVWRGVDGPKTHTSGDWTQAARYASMFVDTWEKEINDSFCRDYNLRIAQNPTVAPFRYSYCFPDGFDMTLLCPIPVSRLTDLVNLLDVLEADDSVAASVRIYAVKTPSSVEYIKGRCHDIPMDVGEIVAHNRRCTGLPCLERPYWWTEGESPVLTVKRSTYLAHIVCSLRDLERVLAHGQTLGFISAHVGDKHLSEYPFGVEWTSFLFPGELVAKGHRIRFRDATPTRQVAYWNLLPPDYERLLVPAAQANRETALAMAAFAEVSASSEPDLLPAADVADPVWVST